MRPYSLLSSDILNSILFQFYKNPALDPLMRVATQSLKNMELAVLLI